MHLRTRAVIAVAAASLVPTLAVGPPVSAAPPPGRAVAVSSRTATSYAKSYSLIAAGARWVVFSVQSTVYAEPSQGGRAVALPDVSAGKLFDGDLTIAGDLVAYASSTRHREDYFDLATRTFGKGSERWAAAAPDGGVYAALDRADGRIHGYEQDAATGAVTDLGALAGFSAKNYVSALADASGVAFMQSYGDEHNRVSYISFGHPGTVTPLRTHDQGDQTCLSLVSNALGCASVTHTIYRVPLDGSTPQSIPIAFPKKTAGSGVYALAFVTAARTYWGIDYDEDDHEGYDGPAPSEPLRSVPATMPHATPVSTAFTMPTVQDDVVSTDHGLYLGYGSSAARGGIYRLSADHRHRVAFHLAGPEHPLARGLGIGSGQVVFEGYSRRGDASLRTRLFTRSGHTLVPGRTETLATNVDDVAPVGASASRVLYATLRGVHVVSVAGNGPAHRATFFDDYYPVALSGTRAILFSFHSHHDHDLLVNLVTGHTTDLVAKYGVRGTPALFGNYLAYGTKDGSIRRLDLVTTKAVTIARATDTSRGKAPRRVVEWGDYVAWDYSSGVKTYSSRLRNARTMTPAVTLPSHDYIVGAAADGVTLHPTATKTRPTLLHPWTSRVTRVVSPGPAFVASSVVAYTETAGDPEQPGGTVYARPLTPATDRPRSLGNPFGGGSVSGGHAWRFDLPTSATLTSCAATVRRHGHTVRTLPCARGLMAVGEVSLAWDGRTASGHLAAHGRYRVVVSAANADGPLLAADGSPRATSATVKVL